MLWVFEVSDVWEDRSPALWSQSGLDGASLRPAGLPGNPLVRARTHFRMPRPSPVIRLPPSSLLYPSHRNRNSELVRKSTGAIVTTASSSSLQGPARAELSSLRPRLHHRMAGKTLVSNCGSACTFSSHCPDQRTIASSGTLVPLEKPALLAPNPSLAPRLL